MKTSRTTLLGAVLALGLPAAQALAAADGWGASWSFGPIHPTDSNHFTYTKTTLVPGRLPPITSNTGPLFLWPGMSNPTSNLIQTTMDAWADNSGACGAATGEWCVEASVFNGGQLNGPSVPIDPDDHVTIEYRLESDGNTWTQTVTSQKLGKVVSTLKSKSGLMPGAGFGFATEADKDSYTIDTAYYLCTELHLAAADPQFGATGVGGVGAQYGATGRGSGPGTAKNLRTPDNGLTWLVDLITLPAMNPQGTQSPPPSYDCSGSASGGGTGAGGGTGTGGGAAGTGGGAAGTGGGSHGTGGGAAGTGGGSHGTGGGSHGTGGGSHGTGGGSHGAGGGSGSAGGGHASAGDGGDGGDAAVGFCSIGGGNGVLSALLFVAATLRRGRALRCRIRG